MIRNANGSVLCCNMCGELMGVGIPLDDDRECPYHDEIPEQEQMYYLPATVTNPVEWFSKKDVDLDVDDEYISEVRVFLEEERREL